MIQQPPVLATSPAGTTNTTTNTTGLTCTVSVAANGATMANYWLSAVSVATSAAQYMITVPAGGTVALQYTVAVPIWYWSPFTPALPATTVAATNTTGKNLSVVAFGGTTTFWYVNGTQVATTTPASNAAPLAMALPPGATISVTYSVAPTWAWMDYLDMGVLASSNGSVYAGANTVAPSGTTGYSPLGALAYPVHSGMSALGFGAGVANLWAAMTSDEPVPAAGPHRRLGGVGQARQRRAGDHVRASRHGRGHRAGLGFGERLRRQREPVRSHPRQPARQRRMPEPCGGEQLMSAHPCVIAEDATFTWGGVSQRLQRGTVLDVQPGSALEGAIGAHRLVPLAATAAQPSPAAEGAPVIPDAAGEAPAPPPAARIRRSTRQGPAQGNSSNGEGNV